VLAYLLCSRPDFASFSWGWKLPALALCLMTAPLLWLAMRVVFDDRFAWSMPIALGLALTLALGAGAVAGAGGLPVRVGHKLLLIGFAVATLWTVVKDWRSDLVANRRRLRSWVAASLGVYVLLVLGFELVFVQTAAPRWLEVLNLAGIVALSGLVALASARHTLDEWLGSSTRAKGSGEPFEPVLPSLAQGSGPQAPDQPGLPQPGITAQLNPNTGLTPPPPALDRKAALKGRLLRAMGEGRAYAQESLTLAQLAGQVDATPAQLREAINQQLGYRNFNDFLHHYRIDEAAQRLHRQDLPILSIALDVGYGSIGPFNRAFKQIKGVTPTEWRAQRASKA
jgi:AraC-like DNA-binding protein